MGERVGPGWTYYDGDLSYATHKGSIVTHIAGNPFGGSNSTFADTVRKMVYGQTTGRRVEFVVQAEKRSLTPYKVVLAFNAPPNIDGHDLCKSRDKTTTAGTSGTLRATIAFCEGDRLKSDAYAQAGGIGGAGDKKFLNVVQQITRSMVPPNGSDDSGGDSNIN